MNEQEWNDQAFWSDARPGAGYTANMGRWTKHFVERAIEPLQELGDLDHLDPDGDIIVQKLYDALGTARQLAQMLSER